MMILVHCTRARLCQTPLADGSQEPICPLLKIAGKEIKSIGNDQGWKTAANQPNQISHWGGWQVHFCIQ